MFCLSGSHPSVRKRRKRAYHGACLPSHAPISAPPKARRNRLYSASSSSALSQRLVPGSTGRLVMLSKCLQIDVGKPPSPVLASGRASSGARLHWLPLLWGSRSLREHGSLVLYSLGNHRLLCPRRFERGSCSPSWTEYMHLGNLTPRPARCHSGALVMTIRAASSRALARVLMLCGYSLPHESRLKQGVSPASRLPQQAVAHSTRKAGKLHRRGPPAFRRG